MAFQNPIASGQTIVQYLVGEDSDRIEVTPLAEYVPAFPIIVRRLNYVVWFRGALSCTLENGSRMVPQTNYTFAVLPDFCAPEFTLTLNAISNANRAEMNAEMTFRTDGVISVKTGPVIPSSYYRLDGLSFPTAITRPTGPTNI